VRKQIMQIRPRIAHGMLAVMVLIVAGCFGGSGNVPDTPAAAVTIPVKQLRENQLHALVIEGRDEQEFADVEAQWRDAIAESDPEQNAQVNMFITQLTADGGIDNLMTSMVEPQLAQADPEQAAMMVQMMGGMFLSDSSADSEEQKRTQEFLAAVAEHIRSCGIDDPANARQALQALADGIKQSGITKVEDLQQLELGQALAKLEPIFASSKQALGVYGFDIDAVLDSVTVEGVNGEGDSRKVDVKVTMFGQDLRFPVDVHRDGDLWALGPADASADAIAPPASEPAMAPAPETSPDENGAQP